MGKLQDTAKEIEKETRSIKYPANSAYQVLTTKVPTIEPKQSVSDARKLFFEKIKDYDSVNYLYAVNKNGKLKGVVSVRDLFEKDPENTIEDVMEKELIVAHPKTKRERLAIKALKANIKAVPIVDENDNFLGVVPSDSILSILYQEARSDFLHLSGIIPSGEHFAGATDVTISKSFVSRIPWIFIGLLGGLATASIVNKYDAILTENILLAGFIPLIAYIANAVGNQTQTLFIRDLATQGEIKIFKYSLKQVGISTLIAFFCSIVIYLFGTFIMGAQSVSFAVSIAIFIAILTATFFSLFIPFLLSKTKLDPAIGSGPFTTTLQDLISIVIYLITASILL
ncbi:magnesium transporter [Candidatus Woesebacteria bacterium]|nr:magnesium transporter [Candidatus Woesebacteria bacterium]